MTVSLTALDATTLTPYPNLTIAISGHPKSKSFPIHSSRGDFHPLKVTLTFAKFQRDTNPPLSFLLSTSDSSTSSTLSSESDMMRQIIGESAQSPVESWDGNRYIFMRTMSGHVKVVYAAKNKTCE